MSASGYNDERIAIRYPDGKRVRFSHDVVGWSTISGNQDVLKLLNRNGFTVAVATLEPGMIITKERCLLPELSEERAKHRWIPTWDGDGEFPKSGTKVLVSFKNFDGLAIGRYEEDEEGGAFYEGDDDRPLTAYDLYVNAWMPLPDPYREE